MNPEDVKTLLQDLRVIIFLLAGLAGLLLAKLIK